VSTVLVVAEDLAFCTSHWIGYILEASDDPITVYVSDHDQLLTAADTYHLMAMAVAYFNRMSQRHRCPIHYTRFCQDTFPADVIYDRHRQMMTVPFTWDAANRLLAIGEPVPVGTTIVDDSSIIDLELRRLIASIEASPDRLA